MFYPFVTLLEAFPPRDGCRGGCAELFWRLMSVDGGMQKEVDYGTMLPACGLGVWDGAGVEAAGYKKRKGTGLIRSLT